MSDIQRSDERYYLQEPDPEEVDAAQPEPNRGVPLKALQDGKIGDRVRVSPCRDHIGGKVGVIVGVYRGGYAFGVELGWRSKGWSIS